MEFKDIEKVNSEMQLVDIKGKPYADVKERVRAFRKLYPEGCIFTEITDRDETEVIVKATISNDGKILATGYAWELRNASRLTETSMVEIAETSAVGRALGFLNLGTQTSIATAEEVKQAQKATRNQIDLIIRNYNKAPDLLMEVMDYFGVNDVSDLSYDQAHKLIGKISVNKWNPVGADDL